MPVGNITLRVAVLSDGTRVITRNGMFTAFKRTQRGRALTDKRVEGLPSFIDAKNLQPFINDELRRELTEFEYESKSGKMVRRGYKAEILPLVCDVYLQARQQGGILTPAQDALALQAEILTRSLAKVGIVALIDEATGYQSEREKDELQQILQAYIAEELLPWTRRFPPDFYREIYRLRGWPYVPGKTKQTQYLGKITNDIVYELLPPGVLAELRKQNPVVEGKNWRAHKHHQFLTVDIGNPNLEKHISQLIVLMRISKTWAEFEDHMLEAFDRYGKQTKLHLKAEVVPKESSAKKLRKFLDEGGRDGADDDFNRALRKASNPEKT